MNILRSVHFLLILLTFSISSLAKSPEEALSKFLNVKGVDKNSVAVKIIDLTEETTVISHNSAASLLPASILKSVTTAALLETVGPDWIYKTRLYIDGPIELGYLRGNIIIEGSCDPTLNSEKAPVSEDFIQEVVEALNYSKINRIEGGIIIDENNFQGLSQPASWSKEDKNKYYGTGSHAFNFNDNCRGDNSVKNPGAVFISQLKDRLHENGIELEDKPIPEGRRTQLHVHQSAPLDEIMRSCMMRSDNMFAESMLRTYGKLNGGDGSTENSASRELRFWKNKKLPVEGVSIIDGSGLSRSNRMTADFMAELLKNMSDNATYASFFPLAGQEGTLRRFLKDTSLDSYIAMKTGSMRGIQCYAGYKLDEDYVPTHVIVIIMNELPPGDIGKRVSEELLLSVFGE